MQASGEGQRSEDENALGLGLPGLDLCCDPLLACLLKDLSGRGVANGQGLVFMAQEKAGQLGAVAGARWSSEGEGSRHLEDPAGRPSGEQEPTQGPVVGSELSGGGARGRHSGAGAGHTGEMESEMLIKHLSGCQTAAGHDFGVWKREPVMDTNLGVRCAVRS